MKPELLATAANEVWSWDITKLRGPANWSWFYLYVILDIYSRYVVGWMVASRESGPLAEVLVKQTLAKQGIQPNQLTIHADRGSSMTSKPVAFLLADLGVTQSHSRPHVSDDNPFSESQFKTLKYRPDFPDRFASIEGRPAALPTLLRLVQRRTPSQRPGSAHPRRRPLRPGRGCLREAGGRAARRLRRRPGALRPQTAGTPEAADRRLDQHATTSVSRRKRNLPAQQALLRPRGVEAAVAQPHDRSGDHEANEHGFDDAATSAAHRRSPSGAERPTVDTCFFH